MGGATWIGDIDNVNETGTDDVDVFDDDRWCIVGGALRFGESVDVEVETGADDFDFDDDDDDRQNNVGGAMLFGDIVVDGSGTGTDDINEDDVYR